MELTELENLPELELIQVQGEMINGNSHRHNGRLYIFRTPHPIYRVYAIQSPDLDVNGTFTLSPWRQESGEFVADILNSQRFSQVRIQS